MIHGRLFGRQGRTGRALAALVLCGALAACGSTKEAGRIDRKLGVAASPRVVAAGQPVPKGGGRYQVGAPYRVAGKWFRPKEDPDYDAVGVASWYGSAFHGRQTANGEVFDRNALTAAHPTLPLPSYVRVTNLANNRSVVVRVNDRGPFSHRRLIDVSERTAALLDFRRAGMARVRVEYVDRARLDGDDQAFLLASYRGPGAVPDHQRPVMVAFADAPAAQPAILAAQPAAATVDAAVVASGTPFDPYQVLLAARAAEAGMAPGGTALPAFGAGEAYAGLRSSYAAAADVRIAGVFAALQSVVR